jgi:hypothetical protein
MTLGCAAASQAHAQSWFQFEAGVGALKYQDRGDGVWYQQGAPSWSESLSAPVLTAGFTGPIIARSNWGIDWHVDYVYMGTARSNCECTPVDANYNQQTHQMRTPLVVSVPNSDFIGSGHLNGIALALEPYYVYRGIRLGVSAGLFPNIPTWHETVIGWSAASGMQPRNISVSSGHYVSLGQVVGASVGHGNLSLSLQHYFLPMKKADYPPIWSGATVLMLKYKANVF